MGDDWLKNDIEKLDNKVNHIKDEITDIKITLTEQHASLKEHMKRSLNNEKAVDLLNQEIKPLRELYNVLKNTSYWLKILIGSGFILELFKLFLNK